MISQINLFSNSYAAKPQPPKLRGKNHAVKPHVLDQTSFPYYKLPFKSGKITKLAQTLYKKAHLSNIEFNEIINRILGDSLKTIRIKITKSITYKVQRKKGKISSFKDASKIIEDMLGAMGITDGSQKQTDRIVKKLVKEVEKGNLIITSIGNFFAKGSKPYLSPKNLNAIQQAQKKPIKFSKNYNWGYTAANIKFKIKNKVFCELQLKGKHCHTLDAATHITYELKVGRFKATGKFKEEKEALIAAYDKLNNRQLASLNKYQGKYSKHLRLKELGVKTLEPSLSKIIPEMFDLKNLSRLAEK